MSQTTKVAHRTVKVRYLDFFYREAGPKDAPALLLLHGFPTSSQMFRNLIPALADRYRVIAPDYPGFGHSSMPPRDVFTYTFDNLAGVVEEFAGQERHVLTPAHDPAAAGQAARTRRAQELDVQVDGWRELRWAERGDQCRAHGVVQHRGQQTALDRARRVEELPGRGKPDLDRPGLGVDRHQPPAAGQAHGDQGGLDQPQLAGHRRGARTPDPPAPPRRDLPRRRVLPPRRVASCRGRHRQPAMSAPVVGTDAP